MCAVQNGCLWRTGYRLQKWAFDCETLRPTIGEDTETGEWSKYLGSGLGVQTDLVHFLGLTLSLDIVQQLSNN